MRGRDWSDMISFTLLEMFHYGKFKTYKAECYGLNYIPPNSYIEDLDPSTSECECYLDTGPIKR